MNFDGANIATVDSIEAGDELVSLVNFAAQNQIDRSLITFRANYDLDVGSVISTTSYFRVSSDTIADQDVSDLELFANTLDGLEESIAQEFRFVSEAFDLGALGEASFIFGGGVNFNENNAFTVVNPEADIFALFFGAPDDGSTADTLSNQSVFNSSIFTDVTWRPFSGFEFGFGARFDRDRTELLGTSSVDGFAAFIFPPGPNSEFDLGATFTNFSPKVSLRYEWTDALSTYFVYSTGYRPGGFNTGVATLGDTFSPEEVRNFEGGVKSAFFDGRLTFNASGFFLAYENQQVAGLFVGGDADGDGIADLTEVFTTNAQGSRSVGSEITLQARPLDGLLFNFGYGLIRSQFTDFVNSPFGDLTGEVLPNSPTHSVNFTVDYEHPRDVFGGNAFVRTEFNHVSDFRNLINPGDTFAFDDYQVVNFRVGLRHARYEIEGFVENANNSFYATGTTSLAANAIAGSPISNVVGEPRRFGGRLTFRY